MTYELKTALTVMGIVAAVVFVLWLALGILFFFIALGNKKRPDMTVPCKDSLFERNKDNPTLIKGYKWYDNTYHQEIVIKNRKGENIHAVEFLNPSNSNVWAVVLHGWTNVNREMSAYGMEYYRRGFNVLMPDLRGHNNSEHRFVTMGWKDRLDVVDWIESIVKENPKARIIIHGTSMGGATTMMTTGEKLPENVAFAVEDCGFTSVKDIFIDQCKRKYHLPPKLVIPQATLVNLLFNGFLFGKASSVEQLKKSVTPTLFIHGDKDEFVLLSNLEPCFEACAAPKEKHIVKGAEHAVSAFWFPEEYWQTVDSFMEKYLYTADVH